MKKLALFFFSFAFCLSTTSLLAENKDEQFSDAELAQMLAPIALYPDSVLTHILIASTYPLEIIQANRWVVKNPETEAAEALAQVESEEWDPSVKALVPFPRILERLSDDLDWTQRLGDAFLQDEARVLASIQSLRRQADQAGNLKQMENMEITREDDNIIIQPIEREVVYVPYYDTRVVYGNWYWNDYQPVYWDWSWHRHHNHYNHHYTPHVGLFSWYPRIHLTDYFFWSAFNWHNHHVVVLDHRHATHRRYRHREHIIADNNSRRWSHNPSHRRGVAYRTENVRKIYNSNRLSTNQTRAVRNSELNAISSRHVNSERTNGSRTDLNRTGLTRDGLTRSSANITNRISSENETTINTRTNQTRQDRLRSRLNTSSSTMTNSPTTGAKERVDRMPVRPPNPNQNDNERNKDVRQVTPDVEQRARTKDSRTRQPAVQPVERKQRERSERATGSSSSDEKKERRSGSSRSDGSKRSSDKRAH